MKVIELVTGGWYQTLLPEIGRKMSLTAVLELMGS